LQKTRPLPNDKKSYSVLLPMNQNQGFFHCSMGSRSNRGSTMCPIVFPFAAAWLPFIFCTAKRTDAKGE
jgi:hypothetical protein